MQLKNWYLFFFLNWLSISAARMLDATCHTLWVIRGVFPVTERATRTRWRNVGECRACSAWWSPACCSSTSPASGSTSSRPSPSRGPFPTATFYVHMEVRTTVFTRLAGPAHRSERHRAGSPFSFSCSSSCASASQLIFSSPLSSVRVFPPQRQLSKGGGGLLLAFVQTILRSSCGGEGGGIEIRPCQSRSFVSRPLLAATLEMMDLEITQRKYRTLVRSSPFVALEMKLQQSFCPAANEHCQGIRENCGLVILTHFDARGTGLKDEEVRTICRSVGI